MKSYGGLAFVTAEEMRVLDSEAVDEYHIDVLSLMENAGAAVASLARAMLGGSVDGKRVSFLVGRGNNGGDGLVAARHLFNWGAVVNVNLASRADLGEVAGKQLATVERMGLEVREGWAQPGRADLLVDSLLGYNARGNPREPVAGLIREANSSDVPMLAVDIPSGLDPTTGEPNDPCIVARATVTLGLPKSGFLNPSSRRFVGELYLGDVSLPNPLYESHSYPVPRFEGRSTYRVKLPP